MRYRQLTEKERYQIEFMLARGMAKSAIAQELKRHRSTIYREIARNSLELVFEGMAYDATPAQGIALGRRQEACEGRYKVKADIKEYFEQKLSLGWSPEQIAGRLSLERGAKVISKNSIYRFIYRDFNDLRCRGYYKLLRFYSPKRSRKLRVSRKPRGSRRSIRERPKACNVRSEIGHFERDLMEGRKGSAAVLVIADRKSRKVFLRIVNRSSSAVNQATQYALRYEPKRTITNDNGHEFIPRDLSEVERSLNSKVYYCDPHSPWQRGTVENSIGLLRQYFPKRKSLADLTPARLRQIEDLLNNRPRKILNFKTPSEIYFSEKQDLDLRISS